MGWPSVPTISRPLRDGLVAIYPRRTRPFAGHLQLWGSAELCESGALAADVCGAGATCLVGAGCVVTCFVVAGGGVLLVCDLVVVAPGDLIPEVCTPDDFPLARLFTEAGGDKRKVCPG